MSAPSTRTPHDWLGHVQPVGLVVAPAKLDELGLFPPQQTQADTDAVRALLGPDGKALPDAWAFLETVLGWTETRVEGAPGGAMLPEALTISLRDGDTILHPTFAVPTVTGDGWDLLVRVEEPDVVLDARNALAGWEATPHQRFERLLRETGVAAGILIGARATGRQDEGRTDPELRLLVAPKGETSGWITWPLASLASVAGREMLAGLKLLLNRESLWSNPAHLRLPAVLDASRKAQATVSERLSGQVLAALHELLRGFDVAAPELTRELAARDPHRLYEGLLTILMRLIFLLYAEDRGLMPSVTTDGGAELYERGYSLGRLFVKLSDDEALYPDLMDERRGAWGQMLALFRLVARGADGFMQRRGGRLFDESRFPFLLGKRAEGDAEQVLPVSDGCLLRVLERLITLPNPRSGERERLSYRTLDVEQIGSVYETVMGFTVEVAGGPSLAIKAGKNDKVPVFVDLAALLAKPAGDRIKYLKDTTGRGKFGRAVEPGLRGADTVEALTIAFSGAGAARSSAIDLRGSPRQEPSAPGTPILQPTDERRRTGSHYTPRSLTAPIVTHALEPAFERIGADATPAQVLDFKICDPAVGSGAFLVEACRQLGSRLVKAWEAHPDLKPPIPADEDDELHARRLVAQRCLYGVDRNPMALDLAKLSLWLATLARDHEFSFLDHALKSGDSLVGLSRAQLSGGSWANAPIRNSLLGQQIGDRVRVVEVHRNAIREAGDDVELAMQEAQHGVAEREAERVRLIGDAIVAAFFKHGRPRQRFDEVRYVTAMAGGAGWWDGLRNLSLSLEGGTHPVRPFHWEIEFPEVFGRENPGFDAIVGNPPFAGKNTIIGGNRAYYLDWLQTLHADAHGNADLSAHFYRRAFALLREGGAFGLIATNTIKQGDTRDSGLRRIIEAGGTIFRAVGRHKWEGEAAVVVSFVFVAKGEFGPAMLNERVARRISAYLVDGDLDGSPAALSANAGQSFQGSILLGIGFTFDDANAAKGKCEPISTMERLIAKNSHNAEVIKPFLGAEELNSSPTHSHHRYAIDFFDRPLRRLPPGDRWATLKDQARREQLRRGEVAFDYPSEVAADWPEILQIVENRVKPDRLKQSDEGGKFYWWRHLRARGELRSAVAGLDMVMATGAAAVMHHMISRVLPSRIYSHKTIVFADGTFNGFATLQSSVHELWSRTFGTTFGSVDALTYNPTQVFDTFPKPSHVRVRTH